MTKIEIYIQDNNIIKYIGKNHAGYDEKGRDIVCAAISTTLQFPVMSIEKILNIDLNSVVDETKGYFECDLSKQVFVKEEKIQFILLGMVEMLKEIEKNYKKYLKLVMKEVN